MAFNLVLDNDTVWPTKRNSASHKDLSYQPSNPVKAKAKKIEPPDEVNQHESGSNHVDQVAEQVPPESGDVSHGVLPPELGEDSRAEDGKVELYSVDHKDRSDITGEKEAIQQPRATPGFDGADEE
jgi:hypothetical protein